MLIPLLSAGWITLVYIAWRICRAAAKAESAHVIAASVERSPNGDPARGVMHSDRR